MSESAGLSAEVLRSPLEGRPSGIPRYCLPEVDSPNRMALALARVAGIDEAGALLIRAEKGDLCRVTAGDAALVKDACGGDAIGG